MANALQRFYYRNIEYRLDQRYGRAKSDQIINTADKVIARSLIATAGVIVTGSAVAAGIGVSNALDQASAIDALPDRVIGQSSNGALFTVRADNPGQFSARMIDKKTQITSNVEFMDAKSSEVLTGDLDANYVAGRTFAVTDGHGNFAPMTVRFVADDKSPTDFKMITGKFSDTPVYDRIEGKGVDATPTNIPHLPTLGQSF